MYLKHSIPRYALEVADGLIKFSFFCFMVCTVYAPKARKDWSIDKLFASLKFYIV